MDEEGRLIELATALPDIARFVETRAMMFARRCVVFGLESHRPANFVARNVETGLISVIGRPAAEAIQQAVAAGEGKGAVLAFDDNFEIVQEALPGRLFERATLHLAGPFQSLPDVPDGMVRFLSPEEVAALTEVPEDLHKDLLIEAAHTPIAATIVEGKAVAFCYAGGVTETLWDISIDTLEGHRRRGYAALCVAFLIDYFRGQGKRPVWGAVQSNLASLRLAERLGFVPVDELLVSEHP